MKALFLNTDARRALEDLFSAAYPQDKAQELSSLLLQKYGSLARLLQVSLPVLEEDIGSDAALYFRLSVSLALRGVTECLKCGDPVTRAMLVRHFGALYADAPQETVYAALLDEEERLISVQSVAVGSVDASGLQPRQVLEMAVRAGAREVILAHNHPGGTLSPSSSDKKITETVEKALAAARIRLNGHCIFAGGDFRWIGEEAEEESDKIPLKANKN